jgi:uridine phosphorylase
MPKIPPSELILNEDGSIYHLHLLPEDVADIVLTVGDPGRVARISRHFDRIDCRKQKREFVTHTGWIGAQRLTVLSTGIGPDNMDIALNELDALVNIDLKSGEMLPELRQLRIIRVGTSGGIQPRQAVDALVCSAYGLGLDNLLHYYPYAPTMAEAELYDELRVVQQHTGLFPQLPYAAQADGELLEAFSRRMTAGITLTSPGFYAPQGRSIRLGSRLGDLGPLRAFRYHGLSVTNFEMETAALYGLCRMLGHRALSCSVLLANRATGAFSKAPRKAVDRLIQEVLEVVIPQPGA